MKFTSASAALALAVTSAAAQSGIGDCQVGNKTLYSPDTVNLGEPFTVKYCSDTYFKTSSASIIFGIWNSDSVDGATVLDQRTEAQGYEFNVTVPNTPNHLAAKNSYFQIVEVINDYYTPHSMYTFSKPVTVNGGF